MMKRTKIMAIALAGAGAIALAAPANAALTITNYAPGGFSADFGDAGLAPGSSYDQSAFFDLQYAGDVLSDISISISSTASRFDITGFYIDDLLVGSPTPSGGFEFGSGVVSGLAEGLHKLRVTGNVTAAAPYTGSFGGQFTIDVAPVPEPASWAMMIGGFGLVGAAMRRRQRVKVAYAI